MRNNRNPLYYALLSVLLAAQLTGCAQKSSPVDPAGAEFEASITKAQELQSKGSYALAELAARKAVRLKPQDQRALLVLFQALKEQSDPKLQKEAANLAQDLTSLLPADSPEAKMASEFVEARKAEVALKSLIEAFDSKSPEALKLLDEVPQEVRKEQYWSLAYKIYRENKNSKAQLAAAQEWIKFTPTGLDGNEASELVQADILGLTRSPAEAFKVMRKLKSADWKPFLVGSKSTAKQAKWLETILKNSKVVGVKAGERNLKVSLQLTHPSTQKSFPGSVSLAYKKVDCRNLLDLSASSLTGAMKIFADSRHTIRDDFWGINGLFKERKGFSSPILKPMLKALGKGTPKELKAHLSPQQQKLSGESSLSLGDALLFDDGKLSVRVHKSTLEKGTAMAIDVDILSPKYRLPNGLGVGSNVSDFSSIYLTEKVDDFKNEAPSAKLTHPSPRMGSFLNLPPMVWPTRRKTEPYFY